jgi:hypothetical protein
LLNRKYGFNRADKDKPFSKILSDLPKSQLTSNMLWYNILDTQDALVYKKIYQKIRKLKHKKNKEHADGKTDNKMP